ncbi:MAG: hypothetical protein ACYC3L_07440 [Gemmatimonadaceae bacterium]
MIRPSSPARIAVALFLAACTQSGGGDAATRAVTDSLAAVRADSVASARQDSINRAQPGYVVDSILPIEEEVRRFRAAVGGHAVSALADAAPSRDALVARFAAAVSARDSVALRALAVSPREFIDLVYPSSPNTKPPYVQAPGLLWSQIQLHSRSGFVRLLERLGGKPLHVQDLSCPATPERQGENLLHANCTVRFATGDAPLRDGRLFGTILERHGRFKFVSFANMY